MGTIIAASASMLGQWILYGAPTYDQVRIIWDMTERLDVCRLKISNMTAYYPGGGRTIFRSFDDPNNARGHTADGVVMDECGFIKPVVFHQIIMPMISDGGGWFWGMGTPNGRNWFFQESSKAADRDNAIAWQIPTLGCRVENGRLVREPHPYENPDYSWEELLDRYETTPLDIFEQEYMASFLERSGQVFRNIDDCLGAPHGATPSQHRGHLLVAGVDWGKQKDYTSMSIGCADCKVELVLYRSNQLDYLFQIKRFGAFQDRWKIDQVLVELNAMGIPNFESMERSDIPVVGFKTTAKSKPPLIEDLALVLERGAWQFLDDPVGRTELEAYERHVSRQTGRSSYGAPEGMNDDTVIARALMVKAGKYGGFTTA